MSSTAIVRSPENVHIAYRLAGPASRLLAFLIDLLVQIVILALFAKIVTAAASMAAFAHLEEYALALLPIAQLLILFGYSIACEMLFAGCTPGKRLCHLRVVRDGGLNITFIPSAIRSAMRIADLGVIPLAGGALFLFGLPALVSMLFSPHGKRLGDLAAGTIVIVEEAELPLERDTRVAAGPQAYLPFMQNLSRITPAEYELLRKFASRYSQMDPAPRAVLAERIARPLMDRMDIAAPVYYQAQYADALVAMERAYAEEFGVL